MKFFILILFNLLSISSVLSKPDRFEKRDLCAFELQSYGNCYLYTSPENEKEVENTCQALNDEKCKFLYENGVSFINECRGENGPENEFKVKSAYLQKKAICEKDENGNSCPYKDFVINNKNSANDFSKSFETFYNETCKSEICTLAAIRAIDGFYIAKIDKMYNGFNLTSEEQEQQNKLSSQEQALNEAMLSFYNQFKGFSEKLKTECISQKVTPSDNKLNTDNKVNTDNKLNTSGIENLKYFSTQYSFSALILVLIWWMYILY